MSRLVEARAPDAKLFTGQPAGQSAKEAAERVAKYVPAEVLGAYLAITNIVDGGTADKTAGRTAGLIIALAVGVIFTPAYLWKMADQGKPKRMHIVIGTLAFVLWSYAMKGVWDDWSIYNATVSGVALIIFSLGSGLFAPTVGSK